MKPTPVWDELFKCWSIPNARNAALNDPLYTADQLRAAQVAVLREAAEWFDPRKGYFAGDELRRMADELETAK